MAIEKSQLLPFFSLAYNVVFFFGRLEGPVAAALIVFLLSGSG